MINLTFNELKKYKNRYGYINLDEIMDSEIEFEREVRGNPERDKKWFDVADSKVMFKANSEYNRYAQYAELICGELAKQVGLEAAEYDLAMHNGQLGVITRNFCKPGEEVLTINELIGEEPNGDGSVDNIDIYFVFNELMQKLHDDGYDAKAADECLLQLRKQMVFDLFVIETDRHTENLSFILGKDETTGKPTIRLAPMYDTETALVLDDIDLMKELEDDNWFANRSAETREPKICVIPCSEKELAEQNGWTLDFAQQLGLQVSLGETSASSSMWKDTLDFLVEDARVRVFAEEIANKLDISEAIRTLEQTYHIPLPQEVKRAAMPCFEARRELIADELWIELDKNKKQEKKKEVDIIE